MGATRSRRLVEWLHAWNGERSDPGAVKLHGLDLTVSSLIGAVLAT
jgi:erythromycin esterase-like protein